MEDFGESKDLEIFRSGVSVIGDRRPFYTLRSETFISFIESCISILYIFYYFVFDLSTNIFIKLGMHDMNIFQPIPITDNSHGRYR